MATSTVEIEALTESAWKILPFAVQVPSSVTTQQPASIPENSSVLENAQGIVGTVTLLNKSVLIWMSWGNIQRDGEDNPFVEPVSSCGSAGSLSMGPFMVGMPRTNYQGAFGSTTGGSSSKLVGCDSEDDEGIAQGMAARLSRQVGVSVLVSCQFPRRTPVGNHQQQHADELVSQELWQQHAAAYAEKELVRILQKELKIESS